MRFHVCIKLILASLSAVVCASCLLYPVVPGFDDLATSRRETTRLESHHAPFSPAMKRCRYFIQHKNRACRFHVIPGKDYCGQHLYFATGEGQKRVPCPLNPGHHVLEKDLARHVRKCSSQRRLSEGREEATYAPDVNRPDTDPPAMPPGSSRSESRMERARFLGVEGLLALIAKVERLFETIGRPELRYRVPEACVPFLKADGRRPFKLKHAMQQASIAGCLMEAGVFERFGQPPLVVEFGAGKAYLSSMLADCTDAKRFVLVDSQAFKLKVCCPATTTSIEQLSQAERTMKSDSELTVRRIRIDLKDFDLSRLPELDERPDVPWVSVGKHLCGSGTDFALLACARAVRARPAGRFAGLFVATCCHHRCDWGSYAAKRNFSQRGFSGEEFELISWMTGWALCDHRLPEDAEQEADSSAEEVRLQMEDAATAAGQEPSFWRFFPKSFRISVGMKCKRLIDACRMEWLADQGLRSEIALYVPADVSPENAFLSAFPREI